LGLPEKPIIVVGHQPEFFHPGILAKFIAGGQLAKEVGGFLVYLVVDHHIGQSGLIEMPDESGEYLTTKHVTVAEVDANISMKDQSRLAPIGDTVFSNSLARAEGENAAMQFANATVNLMEPFAKVDCCIAGTSLLETDLGKAVVNEMQRDPEKCISTYNNAVDQFPYCGIDKLKTGELPLWQGKTNSKAENNYEDIRPRALLLTLLARVAIGDLFVHGTGGYKYDNVMKKWLIDWLDVHLCQMVMASATEKLPLHIRSIEEERRNYYSPPKYLLDEINNAPYKSPEKHLKYLAMHKWLESRGTRPDVKELKRANKTANRRDWAFPLYSNKLTKAFSVAKLT
jgi:hypothetical protein